MITNLIIAAGLYLLIMSFIVGLLWLWNKEKVKRKK